MENMFDFTGYVSSVPTLAVCGIILCVCVFTAVMYHISMMGEAKHKEQMTEIEEAVFDIFTTLPSGNYRKPGKKGDK